MLKKCKLYAEYNYNLHEEYKQLCMYVYHKGISLPEGYEVLGIASYSKNGFYAEVVR